MTSNPAADATVTSPLETYLLRHGDRSLILAQRLLEMVAHAPEIEEDMALSNLALDLIGQTRVLYTLAGQTRAAGTGEVAPSEDDYAFFRDDAEFANPLLVEQPNRDFAHVIARQYFHDVFALSFWDAMRASTDEHLRALADRATKETDYHLRHARTWLLRLGDGTEESNRRITDAVEWLWRYTGELFATDDVESQLQAVGIAPDLTPLEAVWMETVRADLAAATIPVPATDRHALSGGRAGHHSEGFSYLIGEMQVVARSHPGASW